MKPHTNNCPYKYTIKRAIQICLILEYNDIRADYVCLLARKNTKNQIGLKKRLVSTDIILNIHNYVKHVFRQLIILLLSILLVLSMNFTALVSLEHYKLRAGKETSWYNQLCF